MTAPSDDDDKNAHKPQPGENATDVSRTGAPDTDVDADARRDPGTAAGRGGDENSASTVAGEAESVSTEPRADTRIGKHSSQGLAGAQGSGGAAERDPLSPRG